MWRQETGDEELATGSKQWRCVQRWYRPPKFSKCEAPLQASLGWCDGQTLRRRKYLAVKTAKQAQATAASPARSPPTHTATITSITTKTKQKGWPSLPAAILGDAANLGSMTTIGAYALSVALMLIVLINTTTAKFSSVVASSKVEEGYLFRGDPKAKNVVEYHTDGSGSTNFDAVADVDRVLEFYDPHCG